MISKYTLLKRISSKEIITAEQLSSIFSESPKKIRKIINEISYELNSDIAKIIAIPSRGYILQIKDEKKYKEFLVSYRQEICDNHIRSLRLLGMLLLSKNGIKLDEAADSLYVARSSIRDNVVEVRKMCEKHSITIRSRSGYGLEAIGDELSIRKCIYENIRSMGFLDRNVYNDVTSLINDKLNIYLDKHEIKITMTAKEQLINRLAASYLRWEIGKQLTIMGNYQNFVDKNSSEYNAAKDIVYDLCKNEKISEDEVIYVCFVLLGNNEISLIDASQALVEDTTKIVEKSFAKIDQKYDLSFSSNNSLKVSIISHLLPLVNRIRFQIDRENPMLSYIKSHFPLAYELAVCFAIDIDDELDCTLDDDEIGYLAMHFCLALEINNNEIEGQCKVLVVCPVGYTMSVLIAIKLKQKFGRYIDSIETDCYQSTGSTKYRNYDLVVVVGNTYIGYDDVEHVEITPALSKEDLIKVEEKLLLIKKEKRFVDFLHEDLFFTDIDGDSKEEVLKKIVDRIPKEYMPPDWLYEELLKREKISPTDIGNYIAIPHPIKNDFSYGYIAVAILSKPIKWSSEDVRIIILFCLNPELTGNLVYLYKDLVNLFENEDDVVKIIKSKDFNTLIDFFSEIKEA